MELPLQTKIGQSSKHSIKESVKTVSYTDGFEQRAVIGLNQQADKWTINYSVLTETERDEALAFYRAVGRHESFDWQAFGDSFSKKWIIAGDYAESPLSGKHYKVSFAIQQVFDL